MTTPDPLVAFADARIGEDEAAARAAGGGCWRWEDYDPDTGQTTPIDPIDPIDPFARAWALSNPVLTGAEGVVLDATEADPAGAAHIARHDPARVLRESAGRRRTLARHQPEPHPGHGTVCAACNTSWPCVEATDLVATWADHDDYQGSWKP